MHLRSIHETSSPNRFPDEFFNTYPWHWENVTMVGVGRVLSFFSNRRNWDSPNPSPAGECAPPPPLVPGGGAHSLAREGVGESQFRRGDIHYGTLYIHVHTLWCFASIGHKKRQAGLRIYAEKEEVMKEN